MKPSINKVKKLGMLGLVGAVALKGMSEDKE
jgi:hypothetical protein